MLICSQPAGVALGEPSRHSVSLRHYSCYCPQLLVSHLHSQSLLYIFIDSLKPAKFNHRQLKSLLLLFLLLLLLHLL